MFQFNDIRRLSELELTGKRVFVRADLDCPFTADGEITDTSKVDAVVPTLRRLLEAGIATVVGAHLGALGKSRRKRPSLEACGARLADLLAAEVILPEENGGPLARKLIGELKPGGMILLENLARDAGEAECSLEYGRELASGFDVFIGDALPGTLDTTSLGVLPKLCAERAMGLRMEEELVRLRTVVDAPKGSTVWCVGGTFRERERALNAILPLAPTVLVGARLAQILLNASGVIDHIADDERDLVPAARTWLEQARDQGATVILPSDLQCGSLITPLPRRARELRHDEAILDLGPDTLTRYAEVLPQAHQIVMLDDLGLAMQHSTTEMCKRIVAAGRPSYIALDEAQRAASRFSDWHAFSFVSTSKPGVLALLQRQRLPALEALRHTAD